MLGLVILIANMTTCHGQEEKFVHIIDERLKTKFLVSFPEDFACDLPHSFEDLKECFSNLDTLEKVILRMTKHMDEFLEKEPDPYLEEQPEVYWVSEFFWSNGLVKGGDKIPPSMRCNLFPAGGTAMIYSEVLELRHE